MGYLGGYEDVENLTQTGNEREFESSLDGYNVHFEQGLDLFGIGTRDVEFWCPKALYYALQREYSILHPLSTEGFAIPNLWRMSNLYYGTNASKEIPWLNLWTEKYTSTGNTYLYDYTRLYYASDTANMKVEFSIPTTANKNVYDWSRTQIKSGETPDTNRNENGLGFRWKPSTTYTFRFKLRLDGDITDTSMFRTQIGESGNINVDKTKDIMINGRPMTYFMPNATDTEKTYCQVRWEKILGDNFVKRSPIWHECEVQFTTPVNVDTAKYHTIRFGVGKGTRVTLLEPMLYEGENIVNPPFSLTPQEYFEYEYDRGLQGLKFIQPALGFYYSREYDFACAYKVNQLKGLQVLDYNESVGAFKIRCEVDVFKQITNVAVKYYDDNKDAVADTSMDIYNTIAHSNVIDDSGGAGTNSSYFLKTSGKGGIVTNARVNPSNKRVPYNFTGAVQTDTWDLAGYTNVWGNMMYYYTGDAMENKVEN